MKFKLLLLAQELTISLQCSTCYLAIIRCHQRCLWKEGKTILTDYLQKGTLPQDKEQACNIAAKAPNYCIVDDNLYFIREESVDW